MKKNELTMKQEMFCQAYVDTGIASAAYRMAYDCKNMKPETVWSKASRLLASRDIKERVSEIRKEKEERSRVDRARVEKTLMAIADVDPAELYYWSEEKGKFLMKSPHELPKHLRVALKKISNKRGELTYEFNGKVEAARLLASMNGWEQPKEVKLSGDGAPPLAERRIGFEEEK